MEEPVEPYNCAKQDEGKLDFTLVPVLALKAIAAVRAMGVQKHQGRDTYKTVPPEVWLRKVLRHLYAQLEGELTDPESGLPHLHHALTDLALCVSGQVQERKRVPKFPAGAFLPPIPSVTTSEGFSSTPAGVGLASCEDWKARAAAPTPPLDAGAFLPPVPSGTPSEWFSPSPAGMWLAEAIKEPEAVRTCQSCSNFQPRTDKDPDDGRVGFCSSLGSDGYVFYPPFDRVKFGGANCEDWKARAVTS